MQKKFQVFISSTFTDLLQERQAAVEAILNAGHIPAGMELFNAGNESQLETIKKWIDESDIYMLILGGRYGSIEPKSELSYTEVEYRYALEKGIPVFAVFISKEALSEKVRKMGADVIEQDNKHKFDKFREFVLSKISKQFSDSKDIQLAVLQTLNRFDKEFDLKGWISGVEVIGLNDLKSENKVLKEKLKEIEAKVSSPSLAFEKEQLEIRESALSLMNLKVEIPANWQALIRESKITIHETYLEYFFAYQNDWIIGVSNGVHDSSLHRILYGFIGPKLYLHDLVSEAPLQFKINERGKKLIRLFEFDWEEGRLRESLLPQF